MKGTAGKTHCGSWRRAPAAVATRLVCSKPPRHNGLHHSRWSGWSWAGPDTPLVRDWKCLGLLDEKTDRRCGSTFRGTEDQARVKGWRVGRRSGLLDPMCPVCGAPDQVAAGHARDLQRSLRRT